MREAVDFILTHIERTGDTVASTKATQHRERLAAEAADPQAGLVAAADATGHPSGQIGLEGE